MHHQARIVCHRGSNIYTRILRLMAFAIGSLVLVLIVFTPVAYQNMATVAPCGQPGQDNADVNPANYVSSGLSAERYRMPDYEAVTFRSRPAANIHTVELSGWYVPASLPNATTVIVAHGMSGCKNGMLRSAAMLHGAGFAVLLLDLRNHGHSGKDNGMTGLGTKEYLDVLGAWDWLMTAKGAQPERIGLYGISLGAATVMVAGSVEPRVTAVWADSPFASSDMEIDWILRGQPMLQTAKPVALISAKLLYGDDLGSPHQPLAAAAQLSSRALYLVHGEQDATIPMYHLELLAKTAMQAGTRVSLWLIPNCEHVQGIVVQAEEYERRLITFFAEAFAGHSRIASGLSLRIVRTD